MLKEFTVLTWYATDCSSCDTLAGIQFELRRSLLLSQNLALPCCDAKCEIMSLTVEEVQLWFDHFEISDPEPTDQNLEAARTVLLGCFVAGL